MYLHFHKIQLKTIELLHRARARELVRTTNNKISIEPADNQLILLIREVHLLYTIHSDTYTFIYYV